METIVIVDYGSQYTQLIAKVLRGFNQYCEIVPPCDINKFKGNPLLKGIILSGSKDSVATGKGFNFTDFLSIPILGICYGFQLMSNYNRLKISEETNSEFGKTEVNIVKYSNEPLSKLLIDLPESSFNVWMSHSHSVTAVDIALDSVAKVLISNAAGNPVAVHFNCTNQYGLLFHPEVTHTSHGVTLLRNFVTRICECKLTMTATNFIEGRISYLKDLIKSDHVIMAVSGGVDSTVAAKLLYSAIGDNLHCVCIDTGLLRLNEFRRIRGLLNNTGLPVTYIDSSAQFLKALRGITDPEQKRIKIGKTFIDVFSQVIAEVPLSGANSIMYLGQGTIYPDMIESGKTGGAKIKSHHNVGGLPKKLGFKVVEPIWDLFKDEVRRVGSELGVESQILYQHPFPGPGLSIRVMGDVTPEKLRMLQLADSIFIEELRKSGCYEKIWQAGVILLSNTKTVGVMGDARTYNYPVALRAVVSVDGMTADIYPIPYDVLSKVSGRIINEVKGVNRVVYDISSKPPATIEWE